MKAVLLFCRSRLFGRPTRETSRLRLRWLSLLLKLAGALSVAWFFIRVIPKPIRATYPCQQAAFPAASAFILWLLGVKGSLWAWFGRKKILLKKNRRFVIAGAGVLAAVILTMWVWNALAASYPPYTPPPSNSPLGVARGIFPGRVTWIRDTNATPWNGNTNIGAVWWSETNINQSAVDRMMSRSLQALTGATSDSQAWDKIFHFYNTNHSRGNVGYQTGESIALKINCNNAYAGNGDVDEQIDADGHSVLAMLRQLVNQAGVPQNKIMVYEAVRYMPNRIITKCQSEFPNVIWMDSAGNNGICQKVVWHANAFSYSTNNSEAGTGGMSIPQQVYDSTYLVNMAVMKGHPNAGVTLTAKNHYGSVNGRDHNTYISAARFPMGRYSPFVDLIGTKQLGGKTILFMVDGLFGIRNANDNVVAPYATWTNLFGGQWSASYFMSFDPVAIDSVGLDFLTSEFGNYLAGGNGNSGNCNNYLEEAALANSSSWPAWATNSGTVYKPDGVPISSLGVWEHWNDATHKQYSRNLGTGSGIELYQIAPVDVSVAITNPADGATFPVGTNLTLQASASATGSAVSKVDFYVNTNVFIGTCSNSPFSVVWSNAPAGNWVLTAVATDTNGYLVGSAPVNVSVLSGSFLLTAGPASQTVAAGAATTFTVTVTTNATFTGSVVFGVSGLPSGAGPNFVPSSLSGSGSSTLNITTASNTPFGSYSLLISGINPALTNTATVSLILTSNTAAPGTLFWTDGSGTDMNWSTALNWTNPAAGGYGPPGPANGLQFTNTAAAGSSSAANNIVDANFIVSALQYANNAANTSPNYHATQIRPGQTLTVSNGLFAGTGTDPGASQVVNAVVTGTAGTLVLSNALFAVTQGSAADGAHLATLDLSGLGTLNASVNRLNVGTTPPVGAGQRSAGVLYLAKTNVITANATGITNGILVGWNDSQGNGNFYGIMNTADKTSALFLGQNNAIYADTVYVGTVKVLGSLLAFNLNGLNNPTALFRNRDGVSRISLWGIGDTSMKSGSNQSASGTNDFSGGTVDALVGNMNVGASQTGASGNNTGNGSGALTFSAGTIDVNYLTNGWSMGTGTNGTDIGAGTVNVNGTAILKVNNLLALAQNTGTGGGVPTGALNINGGTVLANGITAGSGISTIVMNNGALALTNAAGSSASRIGTFAVTNSALHLNPNGSTMVTNIVVNNLIASGVNTITIDSVANVGNATTFPLIAYNSFTGSVAANFARGTLPSGFSAVLVDNAAQHRIDVCIAANAKVVPRFATAALLGTNCIFCGSNGLPKGNYYVLASTNLALPLNQWKAVATNPFDAGGNFSFTNPASTNALQLFYLLELQ